MLDPNADSTKYPEFDFQELLAGALSGESLIFSEDVQNRL